MDYFGSKRAKAKKRALLGFQSFCVNGLLWKTSYPAARCFCKGCSFNPSGSMDYFGSTKVGKVFTSQFLFQSFWVNGLLWKVDFPSGATSRRKVSILLGQWITLEEYAVLSELIINVRFNPSGSMDYFGRRRIDSILYRNNFKVSILLGQWITLEDLKL